MCRDFFSVLWAALPGGLASRFLPLLAPLEQPRMEALRLSSLRARETGNDHPELW